MFIRIDGYITYVFEKPEKIWTNCTWGFYGSFIVVPHCILHVKDVVINGYMDAYIGLLYSYIFPG